MTTTTRAHRHPTPTTAAEPCPFTWVDGGRRYHCAALAAADHGHYALRWDGQGTVPYTTPPRPPTGPARAA